SLGERVSRWHGERLPHASQRLSVQPCWNCFERSHTDLRSSGQDTLDGHPAVRSLQREGAGRCCTVCADAGAEEIEIGTLACSKNDRLLRLYAAPLRPDRPPPPRET